MHVPLNHAPRWGSLLPDTPFAHRSNGGEAFAASLMEMDAEMGTLMRALDAFGLANDTLVMVAGDNGNWECKCNLTGVPGPFEGRWQKDPGGGGGGSAAKGTVFEAGHRVVGIFRWRGTITPGVSPALLSTLDFLPTIAALADAPLPTHGSAGDELHYDGMDVTAVLRRSEASAHHTLAHPADDCSSAFGSDSQGAVGATRWLHQVGDRCLLHELTCKSHTKNHTKNYIK